MIRVDDRDWYDFEERAGIREFDGNQDRATAEHEALREIEARRDRKGQQELFKEVD